MNWTDQKKRIRRFLRDPDGNIWSDSLLKRLYNDSQLELQQEMGALQEVDIIRTPPAFQVSYTFDWEWNFIDVEGAVHKPFYFNDATGRACTHKWEIENDADTNSSTPDYGTWYSHPWEAWHLPSGEQPVSPPFPLPDNFSVPVYVAWNKEPLEHVTKKDLELTDRDYRSIKGRPFQYYKDDELENQIHLYPTPSTVSNDDITGEGQLLFTTDDTVTQEDGAIVDDANSAHTGQDEGATFDILGMANNILVVYEKNPADIETETDESDFPVFIRKYLEYFVLERAYGTNTDGKNDGLRDYWLFRKSVALEVLKKYKFNRLADRNFVLTTKSPTPTRNRRQPRLPAAFPAYP